MQRLACATPEGNESCPDAAHGKQCKEEWILRSVQKTERDGAVSRREKWE